MMLSQWIGMTGAALLLAHLVALPTLPARRSGRFNLWVLGAGMAVALIPFGEVSAARLVWSVLGYFSVPTLALLAHRTVRLLSGHRWLDRAELLNLHMGICVFALWFYPLAAGIGLSDPWSMGLRPTGLLLALTALGLLGLYKGCIAHVAVLAVAVFAWQLRLFESANLWQYITDPFLGFAAIFYVLYRALQGVVTAVLDRETTAEAVPGETATETGS